MKENFFAKSLSEPCIKVLAWRSESSKKSFRKCFISRFKHTLLKNDSFDFVNRGLNKIFYSSGVGCDLEIVQLVPSRRICEVRKHTNMLLIRICLDFWSHKYPKLGAWFQQSTSVSKVFKYYNTFQMWNYSICFSPKCLDVPQIPELLRVFNFIKELTYLRNYELVFFHQGLNRNDWTGAEGFYWKQ